MVDEELEIDSARRVSVSGARRTRTTWDSERVQSLLPHGAVRLNGALPRRARRSGDGEGVVPVSPLKCQRSRPLARGSSSLAAVVERRTDRRKTTLEMRGVGKARQHTVTENCMTMIIIQ